MCVCSSSRSDDMPSCWYTDFEMNFYRLSSCFRVSTVIFDYFQFVAFNCLIPDIYCVLDRFIDLFERPFLHFKVVLNWNLHSSWINKRGRRKLSFSYRTFLCVVIVHSYEWLYDLNKWTCVSLFVHFVRFVSVCWRYDSFCFLRVTRNYVDFTCVLFYACVNWYCEV